MPMRKLAIKPKSRDEEGKIKNAEQDNGQVKNSGKLALKSPQQR